MRDISALALALFSRATVCAIARIAPRVVGDICDWLAKNISHLNQEVPEMSGHLESGGILSRWRLFRLSMRARNNRR